ncbi:hypothetical protein TL16_g08145 [Triparma laevis f. inornata]|uniref:Adenylate kinase n=1 Tax=Triparma laevis f. inornata TaxID=1714386 RepID=A0A9W7AW70_9STRA|nr:hypothetical protein TL16_g08145 [Triparma laevis f. inornata]
MSVLIRRSETEDQKGLTALISKSGGPSAYRKRFGSYNFAQLIESGFISLTASHSEQRKRLLGYLTLNDSPRGYAHGSEKWLEFFQEAYEVDTHSSNTLWVDFLVADEEMAAEILQTMLTTVYDALPSIDYIVMNLDADDEKAALTFDTLPAANLGDDSEAASDFSNMVFKLHTRESVIPTLSIRAACVEDHDDLVPIFDQQSEVLSSNYGDFFLAEMIAAQDKGNKALVGLNKEDRACGLMAVSNDVELSMLQTCFHLESYDYLCKLPEDETYDQLAMEGGGKVEDDLKGLDIEEEKEEVVEKVVVAKEPPRIIIAGAPASGKGTQCEMLVEKYDVVHLSTGDMLRTAVAAETDVGKEAKEVMESGNLVPDELITKIIVDRLAQPDCQSKGWLLDGFPRTRAQADFLAENGIVPHIFLLLNVPDEDIVARVTGRRLDPETGKIYHVTFNPPEDEEVASKLTQRADDTEEKCRVRLSTYHENVGAIVPCYNGSGGVVEEKSGVTFGGEEGKEEEKKVEDLVVEVDGEKVNLLREIDGARGKGEVFVDVALAVDEMMAAVGSGGELSSFGVVSIETMTPIATKIDLDETLAEAESNCFAITLFCLDEGSGSRSIDFLPHAFRAFPDKDYCILTVPSSASETPLLSSFNPVRSKSGSTFSHCLYVLHKDALFAHQYLKVERFVEASHGPAIPRLVRSMGEGGGKIRDLINMSKQEDDVPLDENPNIISFAATVGGNVIGLVVAHRKTTGVEDINWLRSNYHAEDFIAYDRHRARNQATVSAFAISPTYAGYARYVVREVMRLFDKTVLYYETKPGESVPSIISSQFVPIKPRKRAQPFEGQEDVAMWKRSVKVADGEGEEGKEEEKGGEDSGNLFEPTPDTGMGLHFITKRLLTEPKINCNSKIVVVGGSTAGITFIETLLFTPYLNFTNISLVSPGGLNVGGGGNTMLVGDEDYPSAGRIVGLGLQNKIRIADASLLELDREAKAIVLSDESILPYDVLILTTGRSDASQKKIGGAGDGADGVFFMSGSEGQKAALAAVEFLTEDDKVCVYGNALEALTSVTGLLGAGVKGSQIILVGGSDLGDAGMNDALLAGMDSEGVEVVAGLKAVEVLSDVELCVEGLKCVGAEGEVVVECRMLVFADTHDCSPAVFSCCNGSGLVYDGALVVTKAFKTVDSSIYSGGTMTKFSRVFKRQPKHSRYCSKETGTYLAECVLMNVDPLSGGELEPAECPVFSAPRSISAKLPGGLYYARVSLPVINLTTCTSMITGGLGEGTINRYCVLKTDPRGVVVEFIYLGNEEIQVGNFSCIVGLQEAYLNSCVGVYNKGGVEDWVEFFRGDWSTAVFHDRFPMLHASLKALLKTDEGAFDVANMLTRGLEEGKDDETLNSLRANAVGAGGTMLMPSTKKMVEANGIEFLRKNKIVLNRFKLPERNTLE